MRCGVPNTFSTCNWASKFKNQDFFTHPHQIRKNNLLLSLGSIIKSNRVRWPITPYKKPNDWWRLHLPLVISLKSTHIPVTHLRYDTPPHPSSTKGRKRRTSVAAIGGWTATRHWHQKSITKLHRDLSSIQENYSALWTQLEGVEVEKHSFNKEIES